MAKVELRHAVEKDGPAHPSPMPSSMRDHGAGAPRPTGCEVTRPSRPRCANGPEPRIRGEEGSRRSGRTCLTAHTPCEGARVDPSGYDAGKKVEGKKRHVPVDTLGLLLTAVIHPADVQDRDGVLPVLRAARRLFPPVEVVFADGAYRGPVAAAAVARTGRWRLEIVARDAAGGFVPLPKRWIVERTLAWLGRCRRLAKA